MVMYQTNLTTQIQELTMMNCIPTNHTNLLLEDIQPRQKDKKHEMEILRIR
jgi:hypothetical protein